MKKKFLASAMIRITGVVVLIGGMLAIRVSEPATLVLFGIGLVGFSGIIKNAEIKR